MNGGLLLVVLALAGAFALLLVVIVTGRLRSDRARRRERALRPGIEAEIAGYLADPDAAPPDPGRTRDARIVFRTVAMEAIMELSGREHERVARLLEDTGIVDELCDELSARRRLARLHAAELLSELGSRRAAKAMLIGLLDEDPDVTLACARGLAELGEASFLEPVIEATDEAAAERTGAAAAVMLTVGNEAPDAIGAALGERRSPALRRLAAAVVAERRLAQYGPQLRVALDSDDDELVARAARGLGTIGEVDAVDELLALLEGDDRPWFCRVVAANALGAIGDPRAVPALARQLETGEWVMRDRAATALSLIGGPGEEALERASLSSEPEVRAHAAVALEA